ncbi:hypothetical protein K431DRAFT_286445 [Polychaeton citri CBS 116435]|uniref:Transcription initiation factor TFIID subunit 8 n=1 Tax=Polychaeton citri CBS 116435 TaxID=1314669 RepID=A0A9P4Q303_9PEZI|nr:hypothetical protein K431DRAFT_286445 [Polychaeton citri CBS 116435]
MAIIAGQKRPHSSSESDNPQTKAISTKRRRVQHHSKQLAALPQHVEPVPQDPALVSGQLLRSITTALALAGFDSVKASALESFRAATEEYMVNFCSHVRTSMQHGRRTRPTALDFELALGSVANTSTASLLRPQFSLHLPDEVAAPTMPGPEAAPLEPVDLSELLAPLIPEHPPSYVPRHFPQLPPSHAWKSTPEFPSRERDSRKMREKAMEEGQMAEAALRRLAAAHKMGLAKVERRRSIVPLSGPGKARFMQGMRRARRGKEQVDGKAVFVDALRDLMGDSGSIGEADAMILDGGGREKGADLRMPEGVVVNHNMAHWRKGGGSRGVLSL